jgi:DnaJ-class molecular chaperone
MTIAVKKELVLVTCSNCEGSGKTKGLDRRLNLVEKTCVHCMGKGKRTVNIRAGSRAPRLERSDFL